MIPTGFDEETTVFHPPSGMTSDEVQVLSTAKAVWKDGNYPCVISCWKMTVEEKEEFLKTGRIWLLIMGTGMPPVLPSGHNPFQQGWV